MITEFTAPWILEANALPSLGMPEDSFTLMTDGDPIPEKASEIFDIIWEDAMVQAALDECLARGHLKIETYPRTGETPWFRRRGLPSYAAEGFPVLVRDIAADRGIIRCNFPINTTIFEGHWISKCAAYDFDAWEEFGADRWTGVCFDTEPPLLSWAELRGKSTLHRWKNVVEWWRLKDPYTKTEKDEGAMLIYLPHRPGPATTHQPAL